MPAASSPAVAAVEHRIAVFARRTAKLIGELRRDGEHDGAKRLEALAIEIVEDMRREAREVR